MIRPSKIWSQDEKELQLFTFPPPSQFGACSSALVKRLGSGSLSDEPQPRGMPCPSRHASVL